MKVRSACQWWVVLLLLAGCAGGRQDAAPGGDGAGSGPPAPGATAAAGGAPQAPAARTPDQLPAAEARRFLASHPEALVLDVRNPDEWNDDLGHIEGARQIPLPELPARVAEIAAWQEKPIVVVCRSGRRSRQAAELLRAAGFRQVVNLAGGMQAWRGSEP